jgi:hypothetical protein
VKLAGLQRAETGGEEAVDPSWWASVLARSFPKRLARVSCREDGASPTTPSGRAPGALDPASLRRRSSRAPIELRVRADPWRDRSHPPPPARPGPLRVGGTRPGFARRGWRWSWWPPRGSDPRRDAGRTEQRFPAPEHAPDSSPLDGASGISSEARAEAASGLNRESCWAGPKQSSGSRHLVELWHSSFGGSSPPVARGRRVHLRDQRRRASLRGELVTELEEDGTVSRSSRGPGRHAGRGRDRARERIAGRATSCMLSHELRILWPEPNSWSLLERTAQGPTRTARA